MPRAQAPAPILFPNLEASLFRINVDELKWLLAVLPIAMPTRKAELAAALKDALTRADSLKQLLARLTPAQRLVVAEVAHGGGQYNTDLITAKYPDSQPSKSGRSQAYSFYSIGAKKAPAEPFDLFFFHSYDYGRYMPPDLAGAVRELLPVPPPPQLASLDQPPKMPSPRKGGGPPPELFVSQSERAIFHDLSATLYLVQQGKAAISAATRLPTLPTLRQLRATLISGDYFADDEYERAEDAIRPLALIVLVQAARWAAPTAAGNKLELTKTGQALLGAPLGGQHIREAWERWLKSDLLDELARIRNIKGQQAKGTRLTKPADRRATLAAVLRALPIDRWVTTDELLRYMRATSSLPPVERNGAANLAVGTYGVYYGEGETYGGPYWDVIVGSYLRATLWEYVATLGLLEIAYTWPEESPHDFGSLYYLDDTSLSRYDGLVAMRLTGLGAYVLGLADEYTPPELAGETGAPVLRVLPNLDVVITDAARALPGDRALLDRIATPQSQDVYRLSRDLLLEAAASGLDTQQVRQFLSSRSGEAFEAFPQIVRVFFDDIEQRIGALRESGSYVLIEAGDPFLLIELSNNSALRSLVRLATIDDRAVLLIPAEHEAAARRQLKKLGYLPRKG
jgi:hypothetical protein